MRMLVCLFFGFLLGACQHKLNKEVDPYSPKYASSEASKLRFRNVRSLFYDKEEIAQNRMKLLRLKDRYQGHDRPVLNLAIVNNWMYDEAFVLVEPNAWFPDPDSIVVHWSKNEGKVRGRYVYRKSNKDAHFTFASEVYRGVLRGYQLEVADASGKRHVLMGGRNQDRAVFRKTMTDFYRLVDLD